MFTLNSQSKIRKWIILFFIKLNFVILGSFFLVDGLLTQNPFIIIISIIFLIFGGFFTYKDVKTDPYNLLKIFKSQLLLFWSLRGPIISRQPYYYHFPVGTYLQKTRITRTIRISSKKLQTGTRLALTKKLPYICPNCKGKRNIEHTVHIECQKCKQGIKYLNIGSGTLPIPCKDCLGTGWIPIQPCNNCYGKGVIWKNQSIRISIPENTSQKMKLRIPRLGKINPKTFERGELYFILQKKILDLF